MRDIPLGDYGKSTIDTILSQIPFYADLSFDDNKQFNLLLNNSKMIELEGGDQIIKKGDADKKFYFLLKGQLEIHADNGGSTESISQLTPGQVFGALAVINDQPRIATVACPEDSEATVFATDISIFGNIDDFSNISLNTKLKFWRIVVNNTRWKLEVYKMNDSSHPVVSKMTQIKRFDGERNTTEELLSLAEQSKSLALLLNEWNETMELIEKKSLNKGSGSSKKDKLFSMLKSVRNSLT